MSAQEIFIGRQPILDRYQRLYAYELLFRRGTQNSAEVTDDLAATATVLSHVFSELGLETALGPYLGFVNLDARMLASDALELLPKEKFVLEVLETVELTPAVVARCRELKDKGYTLALDDFVAFEEKHAPILELADIVKVDLMSMDAAALEKTVKALRPWKVKLLAEKVDDEAQVKMCSDLGFELFQGYYFAKPTIIAGKKLSQSELSLIRLLSLILDDAETPQIEDIFKQEPGLTLNLMRLTNSAASGLRQKITSLRHAITVLGRRQLQRWLQLLLYTNPSGANHIASPLLQLAATRGRFLELLASKLRPGAREFEDHAFMTGIMSLMPTLMGVPLEEILKGIHLAEDVQAALDGQDDSQLGVMLRLAEALEASDGALCHTLTEQLPGADHLLVNACLTQALSWASNIGRENT
jgi:EAL and modified HD-GYP domain-containing signal transduction protein